MPRVTLSLTLTFDTPPSIGAGGTSGTLADKVVTRDAQGQFVIPASQVKGKLRHACEQILRATDPDYPICRPPRPDAMCPQAGLPNDFCLLCRLFGSPAHPSPLRFHDLTLQLKDAPDETLRAMVSLNRERRVAQANRLFLIETAPNAPGIIFVNTKAITGHVDDLAQVHLLLAGFKMISAWGGGGSRGLGWGKAMAAGDSALDGAVLRSLIAREAGRA